jgi:RNA polymerase sigma-70 factor (ECF subfamily)
MSDAQIQTGQVQAYLTDFLQEQSAALKSILRTYVLRAGLAQGAESLAVTEEIFQDTIVQVLALDTKFLEAPSPRAWFIRVSLNILLRRRASVARRYRFEVLTSDLASRANGFADDDLLDQLATQISAGPESAYVAQEQVSELLALVSQEDARLLSLLVIAEYDAASVGHQLGISPEAVRVRLHRALRRLRQAWHAQQPDQVEQVRETKNDE